MHSIEPATSSENATWAGRSRNIPSSPRLLFGFQARDVDGRKVNRGRTKLREFLGSGQFFCSTHHFNKGMGWTEDSRHKMEEREDSPRHYRDGFGGLMAEEHSNTDHVHGTS